MNKYHISGVPITEDGKLVGIITIRDMRFETNLSKPISEVMTSEGLVTAPNIHRFVMRRRSCRHTALKSCLSLTARVT